MEERREFCVPYSEKIEKYLKEGEYLGDGHNGIVYLLPNDKVIKIFNDSMVCKKEYYILERTAKSKNFPKTYDVGENFIVRDMVHGKRLDKYLKRNKLTKDLAYKLIDLIEEFKKLHFTRLDIRCKDIFICENGELMIIDPKNNYTRNVRYPRHLMKGLNKYMVLDEFLGFVRQRDKKLYKMWSCKIKKYLEKNIK